MKTGKPVGIAIKELAFSCSSNYGFTEAATYAKLLVSIEIAALLASGAFHMVIVEVVKLASRDTLHV
jgi:hypothetical protein